MPSGLGHTAVVKRLRKSPRWTRLRQQFGDHERAIVDDGPRLDAAEVILVPWPEDVPRPRVGIVRDPGPVPRWTKYRRLLENNGFPCGTLEIHREDWLGRAQEFDAVVGVPSCQPHVLEEVRRKYSILEEHAGIVCYPSARHLRLYEDKFLEAWICQAHGLPFAHAHISYDRDDALRMVRELPYPVVSKIVPSSGSVGVELVRDERRARRIVDRAFSPSGRMTHLPSLRQKNYVYFQEYVENDGLDIRVIVVGDTAQGYYRRVLPGDFRASGMGCDEFGALPEDALRLAHRVNRIVRSPNLAVDMVRGVSEGLRIVEFSPISALDVTPEDLRVDGVPGIYDIDPDGSARFRPGRFWGAELALREFLVGHCLPTLSSGPHRKAGHG